MKKILFFGVVFFFLLKLNFTVFAAPSTVVSLSPVADTRLVDEVFPVQVAVNANSNAIVSTDIVLTYNPSDLQVEQGSITAGPFLPDAMPIGQPVIDNINGRATYSLYTQRENAASGSGILATFQFRAKTSGTHTVLFDSQDTLAYALGESGNVITNYNTAAFTIVTPTPPPSGSGSSGSGSGSGSGSSGGGGGGGGGSSSGGGGGGGGGGSSSGGGGGGKQGDLDGNGRVDITDLSILLRNWNRSGQGDINGNGRVEITDLSILLRNWNK